MFICPIAARTRLSPAPSSLQNWRISATRMSALQTSADCITLHADRTEQMRVTSKGSSMDFSDMMPGIGRASCVTAARQPTGCIFFAKSTMRASRQMLSQWPFPI